MTYPRLLLLIFIAVVGVACAAPAVQPTAEPNLVSPATPTLPTATDDPLDEPVSATPGGPILDQPPEMTPPYNPAPDDVQLQRGPAFVDSAQVIVAESFPPQFFLSLSGSLPTPCHQLRVAIGNPDGQHRIAVEAYSVVDPNRACTQVLEPFEINLRLGTLPAGKYEVWVNNQPVGEIEAP